MYSNTILKLDLIVIIIQKYCEKYLKPDKNIDKIKKSKTIQFVLDQLNDIRKTKDFKTLKSIFTIEKKHKIKDLKDWLNTLYVNNFKLFSKHFNLDVEIDMTKGYRTYVNLLSKLGNNKTKVDLKKSNKNISILFNLLFCNIIVGGGKKKRSFPPPPSSASLRESENENKRAKQESLEKERLEKEKLRQERLRQESLRREEEEERLRQERLRQESLRQEEERQRREEEEERQRREEEEERQRRQEEEERQRREEEEERLRGAERLRDVVNEIMTKQAIVKSLQYASANFDKSITDASNSKPRTLLKIVALMEAALHATESAQLSDNITCIPQTGNLGTCWIISVIAALVYSSDFGIILEYICRKEISKLKASELAGDVPIKTIILTNFRILFILQKYDQIRTHIGTKAYTMPNDFIKQFVEQIFEKDTDKTFFKVKREASLNPTTLTELLTWGGDYSDRQHLITNILVKGFGFTTIEDGNTRVYNYKLKEKTQDYSFTLLHIPYRAYTSLDPFLREKYKLASYKLASYIVVAAHESVRHSVAVVERDGKKVQCNGWCDPDTGCMVQQIPGSTFSLTSGAHTFDFDIDGDYTLALAYDNSLFVHISTIEEEFSEQLRRGEVISDVEKKLLEDSSLSSSLDSSLSSSLSSLFEY